MRAQVPLKRMPSPRHDPLFPWKPELLAIDKRYFRESLTFSASSPQSGHFDPHRPIARAGSGRIVPRQIGDGFYRKNSVGNFSNHSGLS
jgi:hypothetical protein